MIYTEPLKSYVKSAAFLSTLDLPEGTELEFAILGQGEYNLNYVFTHPVTGKKLVLRINTGSQMYLEDQIGFYDIYHLVKMAVDTVPWIASPTMEQILESDRLAREVVCSAKRN